MTDHDTYPAALHLPSGVARLVPGMAVYLIDGVPIDVDVEIPDDLRGRWHWFGSYLCQYPEVGYAALSTRTHGLPGVFEAAREIEMKRRSVVLEPAQMALWEG